MCFCHISDELKSHQCKNFALYSPSNFLVNFQCCCKKYRCRCRKLWISKLLYMYLDLGSLRWTSCLLLTTFKLSLICSQKATYSLLFHHLTWNHASETHSQRAGTLSVFIVSVFIVKRWCYKHAQLSLFVSITRQSLEDRLLDCYIESCEGAPKDKVCFS